MAVYKIGVARRNATFAGDRKNDSLRAACSLVRELTEGRGQKDTLKTLTALTPERISDIAKTVKRELNVGIIICQISD